MRFTVTILLCLSFLSFAQPGLKLTVGTTESIFNDLTKRNIQASSTYTFLSSSAEKIPLIVSDYYYKNGELSMTGKAAESENSLFILKGDKSEIYGWVLFKDTKIAYEYTTDDKKNVIVEQVPMSNVFSIDDMIQPKTAGEALVPDFMFNTTPPAPHIGTMPTGVDLTKLQSRPGAAKVLYMDITSIMNGTTPISQTALDVWQTWQSLASGWSMFELNVTTDKSVYQAAGVTNSGIAKMYNETGRSFSPVNAFGTTSSSTVYRQTNGYGTGRTCLHETGHLAAGVMDYGCPTSSQPNYFDGWPAYQWNTIMGNYWMGNSWKDAVFQWCKGEYTGATVKTDALAYANKKFAYRKDDIPTSVPLNFTGVSTISATNNYGQIEQNTDSDDFTFEITEATGHAKLVVARIEYMGGGMFDADATILDASGKVIVTNNPVASRSATVDTDLPKGKYTLRVKGGAEGTPANGFSNYGSLGFYSISGEITGGSTEITTKMMADNHARIAPVFAGAQVKIGLPEKCTINKIAVFSIDGTRMFYSKDRVNFIDFSGFAKGVYTIAVGIDGMNIVRKIIKK